MDSAITGHRRRRSPRSKASADTTPPKKRFAKKKCSVEVEKIQDMRKLRCGTSMGDAGKSKRSVSKGDQQNPVSAKKQKIVGSPLTPARADKSINIDTKGHCFFCYKLCGEGSGGVGSTPSSDSLLREEKLCSGFMKLVCRHLDLDPLRHCTQENSKSELNPFWSSVDGDKDNFKIQVCNDVCLVIIRSICHLYAEKQKIALQLDWRLKTLYDVVNCADKVPSRVKEFQRSVLEGPGEMGKRERELMEGFRKEFLEKFDLTNGPLSYPYIHLRKSKASSRIAEVGQEPLQQQTPEVGELIKDPKMKTIEKQGSAIDTPPLIVHSGTSGVASHDSPLNKDCDTSSGQAMPKNLKKSRKRRPGPLSKTRGNLQPASSSTKQSANMKNVAAKKLPCQASQGPNYNYISHSTLFMHLLRRIRVAEQRKGKISKRTRKISRKKNFNKEREEVAVVAGQPVREIEQKPVIPEVIDISDTDDEYTEGSPEAPEGDGVESPGTALEGDGFDKPAGTAPVGDRFDKPGTTLEEDRFDKPRTAPVGDRFDKPGTVLEGERDGFDKRGTALEGDGFDEPGTTLEEDRFDKPRTAPVGDRFDKPGTALEGEGDGFDKRGTALEGDRFDKPGTAPVRDRFNKPGTAPEGYRVDCPGTAPEGYRFVDRPEGDKFIPDSAETMDSTSMHYHEYNDEANHVQDHSHPMPGCSRTLYRSRGEAAESWASHDSPLYNTRATFGTSGAEYYDDTYTNDEFQEGAYHTHQADVQFRHSTEESEIPEYGPQAQGHFIPPPNFNPYGGLRSHLLHPGMMRNLPLMFSIQLPPQEHHHFVYNVPVGPPQPSTSAFQQLQVVTPGPCYNDNNYADGADTVNISEMAAEENHSCDEVVAVDTPLVDLPPD